MVSNKLLKNLPEYSEEGEEGEESEEDEEYEEEGGQDDEPEREKAVSLKAVAKSAIDAAFKGWNTKINDKTVKEAVKEAVKEIRAEVMAIVKKQMEETSTQIINKVKVPAPVPVPPVPPVPQTVAAPEEVSELVRRHAREHESAFLERNTLLKPPQLC